MLERLRGRIRYRAYFEGFARACALVEDLADNGQDGEVELLIIPKSTVRALYIREKERFLQKEEGME